MGLHGIEWVVLRGAVMRALSHGLSTFFRVYFLQLSCLDGRIGSSLPSPMRNET
jgi:hypothetical protein